jgi:hypothetical protein
MNAGLQDSAETGHGKTYTIVHLAHALTKHHIMKAYWGNEGIAPRILDLSIEWRWVVIFTRRPLYTQGSNHWYPLDTRMGGPQIGTGRDS